MSSALKKPPAALQIIPHLTVQQPRNQHSAPVRNTRELMHLIMQDARNPKTKPVVRASLARSFAILCETLREMRGIPKAGQLRPDLDPQQLQKALKRARSRKPMIDIATGPFELPTEGPAPTPASKLPQPEPGKATKATQPPAEPEPEPEPDTEPTTPDPEPQDEGKGIS